MSLRNIRFSFFLTFIALLAVIFGLWQAGSMIWKPAETTDSFRYPLEDLQAVPREMIGFQETASMAIPLETSRSVAVDGDGRIAVAGDRRLLIYTDGRLSHDYPFDEPVQCAAADEESDWYVCLASRVEKISLSTEAPVVYPFRSKNVLPLAMIVVDETIWIADAARKTLWRRDISSKSPADWTSIPGDRKHFVIPSPFFDLAQGRDGQIWVVNPGRHQVENVSLDGRIRGSWGVASMEIHGFCGCCNPTHLALTPGGGFVTSEKGIARVKLFSPAGDLESVVATPADFDPGTTGLDLAVDDAGRVMVLDPVRRAVRIFAPLPVEAGAVEGR